MPTVFKIPLTPKAQTFDLQIGANLYSVTMRWNTFANCWVLDFSDQNGTAILQGVPMITGADLLAQYAYLGFGVQLFCQTDAAPDVVPDYAGLGTESNLYFATNP